MSSPVGISAEDEVAAAQESVSSPDIPPLYFSVPDAFHALPIADTPEERAQLADEFVRELFPNGDEELWLRSAEFYTGMAEVLTFAGDLAYSAIGIFAIEEGVAHCSFSVAAVLSEHTDTEVAAQGVRAILSSEPGNDVRWVDLPCGPAVSCVSVREVTFSPEVTKSGEEVTILSGQIQVHVPFPTGPYTAVFTLETSALKYFGEFCDMAATVLRTVSFADPTDVGEAAA